MIRHNQTAEIDMSDDPMGDPIAVDRLANQLRRQEKTKIAKMNRCKETLKPLVDWQKERMRNRAKIIKKHTEHLNLASIKSIIAKILFDIAIDRQLFPIPIDSPFYKNMDTTFAYWFLSFIISPFTTSPNHPSLTRSTRQSEEPSLKYYIRFRKELDVDASLTSFLKEHPAYAAEIEPKLLHLDGLESADADLYTHYVGYTSKCDINHRERDDQRQHGDTLFTHWLKSGTAYEVYEVTGFRQSAGNEDWLGSPQLWIPEYILEMASSKTGFNSSVGGMPQVSDRQERSMLLSSSFPN